MCSRPGWTAQQDDCLLGKMAVGEGEVRVVMKRALGGCCQLTMHKCESRDREEAKDILISLAVKLCHVIGWERKEKDSGKGDYKLPS